MNLAYISKAIYAGVVTFLGALLAALQAAPEIGFALTGASWVTIVLATIIAVGGVLGLQNAPATVATSVK
jgi:small basic protein